MRAKDRSRRPVFRRLMPTAAAISMSAFMAAIPAAAQTPKPERHHQRFFFPGTIVVSRSVYDNNAGNVQVGEILPPHCAQTQGACGAPTGAPYNGIYPFVWNDALYDASFGITSKIYLDQMFPLGFVINSLEVPNSSQQQSGGQLFTSFSSRPELALNLSTDH